MCSVLNKYNQTGKMFDIVKFCQSRANAPSYSKVATGGNDPSISKSMRYSQYIKSATPSKKIILPPDYVNLSVAYIFSFASSISKDLSNTNVSQQTEDFINGTLNANDYLNNLKFYFDYNVNNMLNGLYPLLPIEKATYLKTYANIILPFGSIYPKARTFKFLK